MIKKNFLNLNELLEAEKHKLYLISLYDLIIDYGLENCFKKRQCEQCRRYLLKLKKESEFHRDTIQKAINIH